MMRQVMKEYIESYELEVPEILGLCGNDCRQDSVKLLKVLWAVNLAYASSDKDRLS
jgi:hypothetical protein